MDSEDKSNPSDVLTDFDRRTASGAMDRLQQSVLLILLGAPSLEILHQISVDKKDKWTELKQVLTDRTTNINVVSALLVASCASYITTPPPTDISSWHPQFPYVCMLGSYGCAMLSIVFGFIQILYVSIMGPGDIKAAQTSTFKLHAVLALDLLELSGSATYSG
ncbi:hypothetical protein EDC04DRAFT_2894031 [Pisolithus marmoratus]|nr:hypothetical protein EDC04DRAFT_2894031 [Pisolithus marmoratus]